MERYRGVRGRRNVEATSAAIEASGGSIIGKGPNPNEAPFEYRVRGPDGRVLDLVCYAFTANKYRQEGRPSDEHRFQVKYGSDFSRYHNLFIDPDRRRVTLMYGVHEEEELFVAVDPAMHNPTWFSMSVEFKDEHVAQTHKTGWFGWERERTLGRRKLAMPMLDCRTEVLLGFEPEQFLTYAAFERASYGLDAGERLRAIDRMGEHLANPARPTGRHALEDDLGLSAHEILDVLGERFRLLAAVRGGVAEHHLGIQLRNLFGPDNVERLDLDGQPDFTVRFKDRLFRIECKNALRRTVGGLPRVDFQKTRATPQNPCSRYYSSDQFEVLAACLHPVTDQWAFRFAATKNLDSHPKCPGRLSPIVPVGTSAPWTEALPALLEGL